MKANERSVKFFDCKLMAGAFTKRTGSMQINPKPMADVLCEIERVNTVERIYKTDRYATQTWNIDDMEIDSSKSRAILLINRSDKLAADQAISDPLAGLFEVTPKKEGQGNAYSAHVAINLTPVRKNTYLTALEDSTGISSKLVCQLLAFALRACRNNDPRFFNHPDPSGAVDAKGDPLTLRTKYKFEMVGHPSEDFERELNEGALQGIEVLDFSNHNNVWDDDQTAREKSKVIHLEPKNKETSNLFEVINSICDTARKKRLPTVRVRFTDSAKFGHTVLLDTETKAIINEDRFVKRERLTGFSSRLDTGFKTIHPEIRDKMYYLIK